MSFKVTDDAVRLKNACVSTLEAAGSSYTYCSLPALSRLTGIDVSRVPVSIRVLLESLLRHCDGSVVTLEALKGLAGWTPAGERSEIPFTVARVVLQDLTGVPLLADMAGLRQAAKRQGSDPARVEPLVPVDMVVDHSVMIDNYGKPSSLADNMKIEFSRNRERYEFLKWGRQAFKTFGIVPPGFGIVHQVNLEHLARGVFCNKEGLLWPDSVVGTDSHTVMINGLGIVGWGVGGIEAEASMLGQPIYMLTPDVIGCELKGKLPAGCTTTDVALTVTEVLRKKKVVGKFVEFYGEGAASLSVPERACIANMAPEYGATMGYFAPDEKSVAFLAETGRNTDEVARFEAYWRAQEMFGIPAAGAIDYTDTVTIDLNDVVPSIAGPRRPQDRIALTNASARFAELIKTDASEGGFERGEAKTVTTSTGRTVTDGDIVIAAITSCTNTSNPSVLIAAGLLAKKAVEKGLTAASGVKTSLAPGSRVVTDYLKTTGLLEPLEMLGFAVAAYGCTTCIGNAGDIPADIVDSVKKEGSVVCAVLSGNRNFEARIHPHVKGNFLASPPLVVAYAIAGSMRADLTTEPLGTDSNGAPVYLKDIWPTREEVEALLPAAQKPERYRSNYMAISADPGDLWKAVPEITGECYSWPESTYIAEPPFFDKGEGLKNISNARPLAIFGDSVTTDHISPAGRISPDSPAADWLREHGVAPADFNSFGSRRGNHEVMMRGTFANVRIKNRMVPAGPDGRPVEGGITMIEPEHRLTSVFEAGMYYKNAGILTIVMGGEEYGTGSSRDWAAKGTKLLGVRAVIVKSFERIHRSNLVGMGVLPLQFMPGDGVDELGITGTETFDIEGIDSLEVLGEVTLVIHRCDGSSRRVALKVRVDTPVELTYLKNGGILPTMLAKVTAD